jgi:septal ring factor EnvC (AmiA/AmiB activator)
VAIRVQDTASRKRKLTESEVDELLEKMAELKDDLKELKADVKQKDAKINKLKASKKKCKSIGVGLFTQCEELKLQLAIYQVVQPVAPVNSTESRPGDNPVDPVVVE